MCINGCFTSADAKDLGVFGTTFPVLEKNIITVLKEKMTSEIGRKLLGLLEEKQRKIADEKYYVPKAIQGLTPTVVHTSYLFDPTISLPHDMSDHQGKIFYKAGAPLNPFDHMSLSKRYVFIDGDRSQQVAWAKKLKEHQNMMIILVNGDPLKLMKEHEIEVFFDQEGAMVQRFQLRHIPCVMAQEGTLLRITEWTEEEITA